MSTGLERRHSRRLRAPEGNGAALIDPPLDEVAALVAENVGQRSGLCYDLQGRCLGEVSREARRRLVADAAAWTSSYRDVGELPSSAEDATIVLAGHQPQLFHPGVWFKNFALAAVARQEQAVAVNLLIDTDTFKQNAIPVPSGPPDRPQRATLPLDHLERAVPFEERQVLNRELFASFGERAAEKIASLVPDPLIRDYWPMVQQRLRETGSLGACLAQSRHQLEGRWGLETLEVPESVVSEAEPFRWFTAHLLAQLPRFREVYNETVRAYRREHGVRSSAHPAPDLAADGEWLEAPFWIWTADNPMRRRLFARLGAGRIDLTDRRGFEASLTLDSDGTAERAVEQLAGLSAAGVRIRSRALITTLWARLVLGDMFIHGIGGAKYDQVTDVLASRFFGIRPPGFLVVSATLHLPVDAPQETEADARRVRQQLRELTFHPEVYIDRAGADADGDGSLDELLAAKRRWIAAEPNGVTPRERFLEIRGINEALQPWVSAEQSRLEAELERTGEAIRARRVLCWREYAFCLYPEETLRKFLRTVLPKSV